MKSMKEQKGSSLPRALADEKLKSALGGVNGQVPPLGANGDDQNPDARAEIIEIG